MTSYMNMTLRWTSDGDQHSMDISATKHLLIGRQPECDIILSDPHVSRQHAVIFFENGHFHLHNLSQTNPIIFNDRWALAHDQNVPLRTGDSFDIGRVRLDVADVEPFRHVKRPPTGLKVRCIACGRILDQDLSECPWCGTSLKAAEAVALDAIS